MKPELLIEQWGLPGNVQSGNNVLVEAKQDSKGALYIEGVFMQAEVVNGNKRLYPKAVLERAVEEYSRTQMATKQSLGEMNHPSRPYADPLTSAIIVEKLWWKGNDVMGRARVVEGDYAQGDKLAALIRAGWIPGVSSRGLGVLKEKSGYNEVQDGFKLTVCVDVVWGPSAPNAYVKAVTESAFVTESTQVVYTDDDKFSKLIANLEKLV